MTEVIKTLTPPDSHRHAADYAGAILASNLTPEIASDLPTPVIKPPNEFFDYCFKLQGQIEKQGATDYNVYAKDMWQGLAPDQSPAEGEAFEKFRQGMISGLHGIDMSQHLAPEVTGAMPKLLEKYRDKIASVSIWSKGDVEATAYQVAKIDGSGVIDDFEDQLRDSMPRVERYRFLKEKTNYMVAGEKLQKLRDYVDGQLSKQGETSDGQGPLKVVIIEDSTGNFTEVEKELASEIEAGKTEVIPIWYTGSRAGQQAQKAVDDLKAAGDPSYETEKAKLCGKKDSLNAINSFDELLDEQRFGEVFDNAHVMVDFDGVVGDNIGMREEQAAVTYGALIAGLEIATGQSQAELESQIQALLANK